MMKSHPVVVSLKDELKSILRPALFIWAVFLCVWLFIWVTRLGFQHDVVGLSWGPPGTPVTFLQVALAAAISFILVVGWYWIRLKLGRNTAFFFSSRDALICIGGAQLRH